VFLSSTIAASAADPIRVVCIGNSITNGAGTTDRNVYSYPAHLAGLLGSGYNVLNCGNSGKTMSPQTGETSYWTQVSFTNAKNFNPDIVTIALGTNDATSGNWPSRRDRFHDDYVAMIQAFRQGGKNPQIFVCMPPPSTSGGREPNFPEMRQIIRTVAQEMGTDTIDFYNTLLPYFPATFPDALHPNNDGASLMATVVYRALTGVSIDFPLFAGARVIVQGNMVNAGLMNSTIPMDLQAPSFNNSGTLNVKGMKVGAATTLTNSGTLNVAVQ
jgi:sialate O-acetylesterase